MIVTPSVAQGKSYKSAPFLPEAYLHSLWCKGWRHHVPFRRMRCSFHERVNGDVFAVRCCYDTHQSRSQVKEHPVEEAQLVDTRDVRPPELSLQDERAGAHAPTVLLHEEATRLVGTDAHRQAQRDVLHLQFFWE